MISKNPNLLYLFLLVFFVGQSGHLFGVLRTTPARAKVVEPTTAEPVATAQTPAEQEQLKKIMRDLKRYDEEADERAAKLDKMNQEIGALRQEKEALEDKYRELQKTHATEAGTEELQKLLDERNQQIEELRQQIATSEEQREAVPAVAPPTPPPAPDVIPASPTFKPSAITKKIPTTLVGLDARLRNENAFVNVKGRALHTIPSASFTQLIKKLSTVSSDFELAKIIYLAQYIIDRSGLKKVGATRLYKLIDTLGKTSPSFHSNLTKLAVKKLQEILSRNDFRKFYKGKKGQVKIEAIDKVLSDLRR